MTTKFNRLLDDFSSKISQFQNLFTQFLNSSHFLSENSFVIPSSSPSSSPSLRLNSLKSLLSEWFVCYLSIYDEFYSLYVGDIWLPRHMNQQELYQHERKGRDHADVYKGAWLSKCSMDGIQYEAKRLKIEDERTENRINQLLPLMDSFQTQFLRIRDTISSKLRHIVVKDSLLLCFEHRVEKIEFRSLPLTVRPLIDILGWKQGMKRSVISSREGRLSTQSNSAILSFISLSNKRR
jgi:hypothetical protein